MSHHIALTAEVKEKSGMLTSLDLPHLEGVGVPPVDPAPDQAADHTLSEQVAGRGRRDRDHREGVRDPGHVPLIDTIDIKRIVINSQSSAVKHLLFYV